MDQAAVQAVTDPTTSNETWASVDKAGHRPGALGVDVQPEAHRLPQQAREGYQFSPQWYFLLGQASVK